MRFFPGKGVTLALWQPRGHGAGTGGAGRAGTRAPAPAPAPAQADPPACCSEAGAGQDSGGVGVSGALPATSPVATDKPVAGCRSRSLGVAPAPAAPPVPAAALPPGGSTSTGSGSLVTRRPGFGFLKHPKKCFPSPSICRPCPAPVPGSRLPVPRCGQRPGRLIPVQPAPASGRPRGPGWRIARDVKPNRPLNTRYSAQKSAATGAGGRAVAAAAAERGIGSAVGRALIWSVIKGILEMCFH